MNPEILTALIGGGLLTFLFMSLQTSNVDAAAGIVRGPLADAKQPDLIATQCANCRRVRCVDRTWLPESEVLLPHGCRVSHCPCPSCERRALAEVDAIEAAICPLPGKAVG